MKFNIHFVTYPLIVVAALAGIYFSGVYHQKQVDKAKAEQVILQAKADSLAKAKAHADSVSNDSLSVLQQKDSKDRQVTVVIIKQRDSLNAEIRAVKDTAKLVTDLKRLAVEDDSIIRSKDSVIIDKDNTILFLKSEGIRKDKQYADLLTLNTDTNKKLAEANAKANPGLLTRIVKNVDILGAELLICHVGHC